MSTGTSDDAIPEEFPFESHEACVLRMDGEVEDAAAFCADWIRKAKGDEPNALCIHHVPLTLAGADKVERVEEAGGVRWKNLMFLAPGVWTDAGSREPMNYSPKGIKASANRWKDTKVNFMHAGDDDLWVVGDVDVGSVHTDDAGALYGDIVLSMDTNASRLADEALTLAFKTRGAKGVKGPSVEMIPDAYFVDKSGMKELIVGTFMGLGLVGVGVSPGPASETASFAHQVAQRAVAMSNGGASAKVRSLMLDVNRSLLMADPDAVAAAAKTLLDAVEGDHDKAFSAFDAAKRVVEEAAAEAAAGASDDSPQEDEAGEEQQLQDADEEEDDEEEEEVDMQESDPRVDELLATVAQLAERVAAIEALVVTEEEEMTMSKLSTRVKKLEKARKHPRTSAGTQDPDPIPVHSLATMRLPDPRDKTIMVR